MTRPLVSVLIPCYNAEKTITATLDSVKSQTWPFIEIIVINDGSTDNSAEIIRQHASPKIRLLCQANFGQTGALNACVAKAQGQLIQYLDADDLISPNKIELQVRRLMDNPDCIASAEWGR